jgi:glutathione S-transferase
LERDGFSVADVAVGGLLLYVPFFFPTLSLDAWPAVQRYCARLAGRRACALTLAARIAGAQHGTAPPAPPTRGGTPAAK